MTGLLTSTARFPLVPGLCRKLTNFLWIVDCVSRHANARPGFNDLSLLFESMVPSHSILKICCVALSAVIRLALFSLPHAGPFSPFVLLQPDLWGVSCYSYRIPALKSPQNLPSLQAALTIQTQFYTSPQWGAPGAIIFYSGLFGFCRSVTSSVK